MTKIRIFGGILAVFLLFSVGNSDAGPQQDHQAKAGQFLNNHNNKFDYPQKNRWSQFPITRYRVMKELGLTDDQWGDMKNLRENLKEEMRKIRTQHKEDMLDVLTSSQRDSLNIRINEINKFKREHRNYHRDMRRDGSHQKPGHRQRSRNDLDSLFFKQIDYVEPEGGQYFGVSPLYNNHNDLASKIAIINKPIAYNSEKTTWGKIKNLFE